MVTITTASHKGRRRKIEKKRGDRREREALYCSPIIPTMDNYPHILSPPPPPPPEWQKDEFLFSYVLQKQNLKVPLTFLKISKITF